MSAINDLSLNFFYQKAAESANKPVENKVPKNPNRGQRKALRDAAIKAGEPIPSFNRDRDRGRGDNKRPRQVLTNYDYANKRARLREEKKNESNNDNNDNSFRPHNIHNAPSVDINASNDSPIEQSDDQPKADGDAEDEQPKRYIAPAPLSKLPKLRERTDGVLPSELGEAAPTVDQSIFSDCTFQSLPLARRLVEAVYQRLHLKHPTAIQQKAIPALVDGRDALVRSNTGSGKTLCYLLPLVESLTRLSAVKPMDRTSGIHAIILAPTRELVLQINQTLSVLLQSYHWLICGPLMGGETKNHEKARLRKGMHIIVATPGRLVDHIQTTACMSFSQVRWLVMDEADRLLDLGFEKDVRTIIQTINQQTRSTLGHKVTWSRQSALFSATMNDSIQILADLTLHAPLKIGLDDAHAASPDDTDPQAKKKADMRALCATLPASLEHFSMEVESRHRLVALSAFIRQQSMASAKCKLIVFFSTCASVSFHHALLTSAAWPPLDKEAKEAAGDEAEDTDREHAPLLTNPIYALHGSMTQKDRTSVFHSFAASQSSILLCTDVASRGLDLPAVDWVVQFDIGEEVSDYIHRVGRSARIGREGRACIFVTSTEKGFLDLMTNEAGITFKPLSVARTLNSLRDLPDGEKLAGEMPAGLRLQRQFESMVLGTKTLQSQAVSAYQSFLRAYAAYPRAMKQIGLHPKSLHLGHVCRSFGLTEEPTRVGAKSTSLALIGTGNKEDLKAKGKTGLGAKSGGQQNAAELFKKRNVVSMASEFAS